MRNHYKPLTTRKELKNYFALSLHKQVGQLFKNTKKLYPYVIAEFLPNPLKQEINNSFDEIYSYYKTQLLRKENFIKVIRANQQIKYLRFKTPKGHRSVFSYNPSELPKPIIFNQENVNYHTAYFQLLYKLKDMLYTNRYPLFYRFDIKKAYPSITKELILHCYYQTIITNHQITSKSRNFIKNYKQLKLFLDKYENHLFSHNSLKLGSAITHKLAHIVYNYISLNLKADVVFNFEDDFVLFFRRDKRKNYDKLILDNINFLSKLNLNLNPTKSATGYLFTDSFTFLGHKVCYNNIKIDDEKIILKKLQLYELFEKEFAKNNLPTEKQLKQNLTPFRYFYREATNNLNIMNGLKKFIKNLKRIYYCEINNINYYSSFSQNI